MKSIEKEFKKEFELAKRETHEKFRELFSRFLNVKNWKINFEYDWSIPCSSSIDEEDSGWSKEVKKQ